ncbi:MAG: hypothetical protein HQK87_07965, partial [Nitrospinae bacterium]|nr:hypothetical protein [Nitrospinota bacterium]
MRRHAAVLLLSMTLVACSGAGRDNGGSTTTPLSTDRSFTTPRFAGSDACVPCHDSVYGPDGVDLSLVADARASAMGMSAIDPVWRAKAATELIRAPHLAAEIADT